VQQGITTVAASKEEGWREVLCGRYERRYCAADLSCKDSKMRKEGGKEIRDRKG
jgi:hypothetical protein